MFACVCENWLSGKMGGYLRTSWHDTYEAALSRANNSLGVVAIEEIGNPEWHWLLPN